MQDTKQNTDNLRKGRTQEAPKTYPNSPNMVAIKNRKKKKK